MEKMEDHASHHGVELYDLVIAVKALIKISLAIALGSFRQALARLVERKVQETKLGDWLYHHLVLLHLREVIWCPDDILWK